MKQKMRKAKRWLAGMLACMLLLTGSLWGNAPAVEAADGTFGDYTYAELEDGTLEITGYTGTDTEITIPAEIDGKQVTSIGEQAFCGEVSSKLTNVILPDGLKMIQSEAFYNCYKLKEIVLPNTITDIGDGALGGCNFKSVTIPASVKNISGNPFTACGNLTDIMVEEENSVYDSRNNCNAIIKTDEQILIAGCSTTVIPEGVQEIADNAFYGCITRITLDELKIPDSVTSIGKFAFFNCSRLMSIVISDSVTSIGESAFFNCGLTSITIPVSVTNIVGDGEAFSWCSNLEKIVVEEGNPVYDSRNNCNAIIKTNENSLIVGGNTTVIPEGITEIGTCAFECRKIEEITIPNSVKNIGDSAFSSSKLRNVVLPDSIRNIGNAAFASCRYVESIVLPNNQCVIGDRAFEEMPELKEIIIPDSIVSIGERAFGYDISGNLDSDFTICGAPGTVAEDYAVENGILFNS